MNPISRFALLVFLWLPFCFAAWYFLSILFVTPIAAALDQLMPMWLPSMAIQIAQDGNRILVVLELSAQKPGQLAESTVMARFHAYPLDYSYGIALYTAMLMASATTTRTKIIRWILGVTALLLISVSGVAAHILKVIFFETLPQLGVPFTWPLWTGNMIILAYKLTYLLFTPVAPIAIWMVQFRNDLHSWTGVDEGIPRQ
jgi:hypothetical protein